MNTIEIHELEVKETKSNHRVTAAAPNSELVWGPGPRPSRPLFSDCLLEFGPQRKRKFFATTTSFVINILVILLILLIPLAFTEQLPSAQLLTFLVAPAPPPPPPPPAAAEAPRVVRQVRRMFSIMVSCAHPQRFQKKCEMMKEIIAPPPMAATGGVVGGVGRAGLPADRWGA